MKATLLWVSLLWSLVEVHSQTLPAPYVSFMGENLTNHSYVDLTQVGNPALNDDEHSVQCHTDLDTCCSSDQGQHRGDWYFPDGDRLPFASLTIGIHEAREAQQVEIRRNNSANSPSGIYRCDIATNAVNDDTDSAVRETVYVGVYATGGDLSIPAGVSLLVTSQDTFTLTCISTGGPATTVTWTRDSVTVTEGTETVLDDPVTAQYTHTLTGSTAGVYTCTVANNKPSIASASITVEDVLVVMLGSKTTTSLTISWALADGVTATAYTISYSNTNNTDCITANYPDIITSASESGRELMGLEEGTEYSITVTATLSDGGTREGSLTATTMAAAPSAAPSNARATSTSSTITVQWEMVPCIHHNGEITGYSVRYGVQGQSTQTMTVSGGDTTMTTIEGVMSSTTYSIEVAAVNSVDTGPYSEAVIIDIPQSVFLSLNGDIIPNHGYVVISDIGSTDNTALLCHTNGPTSGSSVRDWFAPDGTTVGSPGSLDVPGFERNRAPMLVRLRRNDGTPEEGIYHCEVEDADDIIQTLYVGLYNNGGGMITKSGGVTLTVDSDLNGPSPQFTLTCISTGGPATTVTWTRGSVTVTEETGTVLDDPVTAQYTHTLTGSTAGVYTCTVANNKPSSASASIPVGDVLVVMLGSKTTTSLTISWALADGVTATAYTISYSNTNNTDCITANYPDIITSASELGRELMGLEEGTEYSITVTATLSDGGTREGSLTATTMAAAPSAAPSTARATSTSSTITVQWEMVPCIHHNGEITGYSVTYGVQGQGTQTMTVSGGDTTMTTIEGVMSSTTYSIEVAAVNSVDTGPYSEAVIIDIPQSVFLSLNGDIIPNHGYVVSSDIGSTDNTALLCHTNGPTSGGSVRDWFAPDGTTVGNPGSLDVPGFERNRAPMLVRLRRNDGTPEEGIYYCEVEDADDFIQTLYVGLYNNGGGMITKSGGVTLTVDSDLNGPSPQFTLTCISTGGPATTVTWTRGSETAVGIQTSLVVDGVTALYTHTLTVTGRLPGVYTCTVDNEVSPQDSESFTVQVASAPTNVMAVQEGLTSIRVSWTPSSGASGYTISYTGGGSSDSVTVSGGSTDNYLLTGLVMEATYTISIVATSHHFFSNAVELQITLVPAPGQPSVSVTAITATSISLSWSVPSGSVVTSSEVMWREASSGTSEGTSGSLTDTSYTIDQLESTTSYNITVTVSNTAGTTDSQPVIIPTRECLAFLASGSDPTCLPETTPPTPTITDPPQQPNSSELDGGIVAAIVVTLLVAVLLVVAFTVVVGTICWRRRKSKNRNDTLGMSHIELKAISDKVSDSIGTILTEEEDTSQLPEPLTLVQKLELKLRNKNMMVPKHRIHISDVVGQGVSGLVYRGYLERKDLVAIKTVKALSSPDDKAKLLKEVSIMASFTHPNVMSLLGLCYEEEMPLLIMPFMSGGNVLKYVRQNKETLYLDQDTANVTQVEVATKTCLDMCHQVAKGMSYLARYKFVHRDLAARNCMIDSSGVIKVADFGLTEEMYSTNYFRRRKSMSGSEEKVPIRWMAPESIDNNVYSEASDVWSYGVTCWEVFTCGSVPYAGVPALTLSRELSLGHRLPRPSNAVCSDEIWNMMMLCWCKSSHERPHFSSLVDDLSQLLETTFSYLTLRQ